MIPATMMFAPISAFKAGLRSKRAMPLGSSRRRLNNGAATALLIGSTTAHRQADCGLDRAARLDRAGGRRRWVEVATGDVECGQGGFRLLRLTTAARLGQTRDRLVGACRAGRPRYRGEAMQLARQNHQSTVDINLWTIDQHC